MSRIEQDSIKMKARWGGQIWPYGRCPKCGEIASLCQDGFPLLTDWWFYCPLCPYNQQIAPISQLTPQIKAVDVADKAVFERVNANFV